MYTSNKLFPGVIDTIPSDNNTRGHTFSQDLDWLSCGERWQSLHLLIWHVRSCMLCSTGANAMRSDQWQKKQMSHFFPRLGLVVLWWTMTKSSSAYMTFKKLYALLVPTTWEVTNDKQFQFFFAHTFSQDLDWLSLDNNDQIFSWWYDIKEVVALPL